MNPSSGFEREMMELTQALIARPSVTPNDAGCQRLIAERLQRIGCVCEQIRCEDVENLWVTHGSGRPVVVLLGHTDVVPPGPAELWQSDPFVATVRAGRLYGRGVADMKSSVAAFVIAIEQFVARYPAHPGTLACLLTSDEEGPADHGVREVAAILKARDQAIDLCITGEPSSLQRLGDTMRVGRRGSLSAQIMIKGVQGHVAYPHRADNPVHRVVPMLHALIERQWDQGQVDFPPTSLQLSNIHAGTGTSNLIPDRLELLFNLRYGPGWTADLLERELCQMFEHHQLNYQVQWHRSGEPFYTPEGPLRQMARAVLTEFVGSPPDENTGGGTSDARFIAPLGAQCIEIGPVSASIHQANEWIDLNDLRILPALYLALVTKLLVQDHVNLCP